MARAKLHGQVNQLHHRGVMRLERENRWHRENDLEGEKQCPHERLREGKSFLELGMARFQAGKSPPAMGKSNPEGGRSQLEDDTSSPAADTPHSADDTQQAEEPHNRHRLPRPQ
jgi:hypothetical protein